MSTSELQRLKMAWIAAKEAGDVAAQQRLLRDHPSQQEALIDFIAGYYATTEIELEENASLLPLTQRACQSALTRVFSPQAALSFANVAELRKQRSLSKVEAARGLRMGVDVWNKFESGAIELVSLSNRQLERLAQFFQVSVDQFSQLLTGSQPSISINRRQTQQGAASEQQGPGKQTFEEAIARSTMAKEDKQFWLDAR